jgi:hypothetical protein
MSLGWDVTFCEDYIYIKSYFATRFIIFDDIEEEIVVLSGNWIFTFTFH